MEPMLRFKADDGANFPNWEEKTLGEICEQLKASIDPRNNPTKQFIEYSMPAYDNHMAAQAVLGQSMNSARKILSAPCVLINKLNVRKRRIWVVEHPEDNAVCSSEFVPLTSAEFDLRFLGYLAMTDSFTGYLLDCSSGSSNSQKRVTPDTILQYLVSLPSLPEQRKIADLLSVVDDVIAAQEAEVAAWEKRKKGVMQKLFSQEVRFKADDGSDFPDWEEKTLGELTSLFVGKSFASELNKNGRYAVMDMGGVSPDGFIIDAKRTNLGRDVLRRGDLIMPKSDMGKGLIIGKTAYIPCDDKYVCGDSAYRLRFDNEIDSLFMHYEINSSEMQKRLWRKVAGSAQLGLNSKSVSSETVFIPPLPEQRKIADCLASMDEVIQKAKGELAKWQELKKGLLQQMFV